MTDVAPLARPFALKPFRGLRYAPERVPDLAAVTSPPYDVLDAETIATLEATEPHNIVRVILPRLIASAEQSRDSRDSAPGLDGTAHYRHAAELFHRWRAEGILVPDTEPALYVYEQRTPRKPSILGATAGPAGAPGTPAGRGEAGSGSVLRGLLGAAELRLPDEHVILPHEDVLPGPVEDRLALLRACAANLEPILLAYDGGGDASDLVEDATTAAPMMEARTQTGESYRVWRITDPARISAIAADLAPRQALIADGHHRYATYLRLQEEIRKTGAGAGPWDSGLALVVDQRAYPLDLTAIHRTVAGLDLDQAVARAADDFQVDFFDTDVEAARSALASCRGITHGFLLTDGERWTLLRTPPGGPTAPRGRLSAAQPGHAALDTEVLHGHLLGDLLGVKDDQIDYLHDDVTAVKAAQRGGGLAILLNPVELSTVQAVARDGGRMPRKSTSFGPKPRSGFVMRALVDG
ncbi:DUF1015 family protein [Actinopolymorpha alba]|uniref:DUF1015 family protein n=1 Tax=Actinopolymorpha alba TaxID=533267 RepID=UPI00192C2AA2|nr:DUF1015 domain-containing protein [Actinopolymorpha alba]